MCILEITADLHLFVYVSWAANSKLRSSFDIYPTRYFEYLSFAAASVVGAPVFVVAVDVAVVALRASRTQNTCLDLLVSVP